MLVRHYYNICFLLIAICGSAQGRFETDIDSPSNAIDAEKVYLQLSATTFNTEEVIWFKAVVSNAYDLSLSGISGVLHVELIEPTEKQIIDSKLLKLDNGIAESFFQLHSNYSEGKYLIRAYTEWNKNFDDKFMFSTYVNIFKFQKPEDKVDPVRDISILKDTDGQKVVVSSRIFPMELDSLHRGKAMLFLDWLDGADSIEVRQEKNHSAHIEYALNDDVKMLGFRLKTMNKSYSKSIVLDETQGSLEFFPEGGELVNGIKSTLGFKYLNINGKGENVFGVIVDQHENELSSFKSNDLGMGKIELLPEEGKDYFGLVKGKNGIVHKYPIPTAKSQGTVMQVVDRLSSKVLVLEARPRVTDSVHIKLYHRGKDIYLLRALMKDGEFRYPIGGELMPNGIIGATMYDSNYLPRTARHFFNNSPKTNLNIDIEIGKTEYETRDSVVVRLKSMKENEPVASSISLMAVDKEYFEKTNLSKSSILSYFLLESDIKGDIENPAYYFDNENNLKDLDYLMLTQGWSNYKYDEPQKIKIFLPEKGLTLSGHIDGWQKRKRRKGHEVEEIDLTLMTFGKNPIVYQQKIDSTGYFNFELEESYGEGKKFVIEPKSSTKKNVNLKIDITRREIPEIDYEFEKIIVPVDSTIKKTVKERIASDITTDPYLLPNTIALNEVVVSDYILTPEREQMKERHGMPDVVIDNKELLAKEKSWTDKLFRWLLFNYSEELSIKQAGGIPNFLYANVHGADFTFVLIDGEPVVIDDYYLIPDIPIEAVKSVEILKRRVTANRYLYEVFPRARGGSPPPPVPAILAIYTYSGKGLYGAFPKKSRLIKASIPEFSPKREFYSPAYDNPDKDAETPDLRRLIHWQPDIRTDDEGKAIVKFYNGDITGEVLIICEGVGITQEGIGRSEISYDVVE